MAEATLYSAQISPNRLGSIAAFLEAWREHERLDTDPDVDSDTQEYARASFAYNGGEEWFSTCWLENHTEAALAALITIKRVDLLLCGFYSVGAEIDPDEAAELNRIRKTLVNLWRFHDKEGADPVTRPFAEAAEVTESHDLIRWRGPSDTTISALASLS